MIDGTGSFVAVARGSEDSVAQGVDCPVVGGAESFVVEGTGYSVAGSAESFGGTSLIEFADHHPSPLLHALLHFCKLGIVVPMSIFLWPS